MRRGRLIPLAAVCALLLLGAPTPSPAVAAVPADHVMATGLPDAGLTPGATNPAVTPATLSQTICRSGWTATVRPPSSYTTGLKRAQIVAYGFNDTSLSSYEEDHLVPLELGGSPASPQNLWPEPYHVRLVDGTDVGARAKDQLENSLKRDVCAGRLSLATAQRRIAVNWVKYWLLSRGSGSFPATPAPTAAATTPVPTPTAGAGGADPYGDARAAGATAICRDGTWSYSQHRSGTCSGHGGVRAWL